MTTEAMQRACALVQSALCYLGNKAHEFAKEEHGGSEIIAVVAVAAVAVLLAFLFRDAVGQFITTTVGSFTSKVNSGFSS